MPVLPSGPCDATPLDFHLGFLLRDRYHTPLIQRDLPLERLSVQHQALFQSPYTKGPMR
jgi:hypothetical protein